MDLMAGKKPAEKLKRKRNRYMRKTIPAIFMRGGTSKGVFFHEADLPDDPEQRDQVILEVLGSPDPYQRQLNGMGGGISSLSKAMIVTASDRSDADVDYTFAQVSVTEESVGYAGNCGNLSSAIGPFAVEEGLIKVPDGETTLRLYNTNTDKIIQSKFHVRDSLPVESGDFEIAGVAGTGAEIALDYLDPGGAITGQLIPTGKMVDTFDISGFGTMEASVVDSTACGVFAWAHSFGLTGTESPDEIEAKPDVMAGLEELRVKAAVLAGVANRVEDVPQSAPKVSIVAKPADFKALDGTHVDGDKADILIRIVSMQRVHRATTMTGAMCLASACKIEGTIPYMAARHASEDIVIGHSSGLLPVASDVESIDGKWNVIANRAFRTARRLMEGRVALPT
jgi:2-methylaconitate isomerase